MIKLTLKAKTLNQTQIKSMLINKLYFHCNLSLDKLTFDLYFILKVCFPKASYN